MNEAKNIVKTLQDSGYTAYFAGGCVRDKLLDREPHDIDIATNALPEQIKALFDKTINIGESFGVVNVVINDEIYDIATFRSDGVYTDGRRPDSVTFCSAEEDAKRRDLTINGMFYDPITEECIDFVDGKKDIENRVIRMIGNPDERIAEDKLRMMRVVRFYSQLRYFEIDINTYQAVADHANEINQVSIERIREEFSKTLLGQAPYEGIFTMVDMGIIKEILPEFMSLEGVEQPPQYHPEGDVYTHTMIMLKYYEYDIQCVPSQASLILALAILFHDIGKPATFKHKSGDRIRFNGHDLEGARMTDEILRRMTYPNEIVKRVVNLVRNHMKFYQVKSMKKSTLKRFLMQDDFDLLLKLNKYDSLSSGGDLTHNDYCIDKMEYFKTTKEPIRVKKLVTGQDLIDEGYTPRPIFKDIILFGEDLQLENPSISKQEILDKIADKFER